MLRLLLVYTLLISSVFTQTSCDKEAIASPIPEKELYVSSELITSVPRDLLRSLAAAEGHGAYANEIKYGVSVYKLTYITTYRGKEIKASGLVCVPQGMPTAAPVISAQHGTIFTQADAPTSFTGLSGFELFAAAGYVMLIPDYIGFGESKQIFHPYYDQKHSAMAVVDMIKAAPEFCSEKDVTVNEQLFLVGYSEGGYVTLAAQKEIETNPQHKLKITASAAGAGGYDLTHMLAGVTAGKPYTYPAYLAYILQAYNQTNSWNRPLNELFQEPYAEKLPRLFNGNNGGSAINRELTTDPQKLFAPAFYNALKDPNQERALKQALQANSFNNWVPQSPTRLYHGTADNIVPFENSKLTYERFKANGAAQTEFISIAGGTHSSSFGPMLQSLVPWIKSF
ncbi:lipase family protein [uncultured Pontibacter sp.]|uniref:lipase family protein n=1 Tax=uncultured Pontibacter sp. TaxID=453356 RepID=UPI002629B312|nr:lipase family protein [uncultured Pontibacter sp.]